MRITNLLNEYDFQYIHKCLSGTYWAKNRTYEQNKMAFNNSLPFMLLDGNGNRLGFGRVFTDYVTIAYLSDVYIDEQNRGIGLGKYLIKNILEHQQLQQIKKFLLKTSDAAKLYNKFGFSNLKDPEAFMEKYVR